MRCKKRSLAFPPMGGQMDPRLRATGAGQESSSSLIPQERKLRDILLSVPPKRGKGTSPLFLRPTFQPRRALPWILLSVTLSCSFDRRVDTRFLQTSTYISIHELFNGKRSVLWNEIRHVFSRRLFLHLFPEQGKSFGLWIDSRDIS